MPYVFATAADRHETRKSQWRRYNRSAIPGLAAARVLAVRACGAGPVSGTRPAREPLPSRIRGVAEMRAAVVPGACGAFTTRCRCAPPLHSYAGRKGFLLPAIARLLRAVGRATCLEPRGNASAERRLL